MSDAKQPAEFFSDEHKQSHVAGLVRELEAYEAKVTAAETSGDDARKAQYSNRADQVREQLKRLGADAKTGSARAARR